MAYTSGSQYSGESSSSNHQLDEMNSAFSVQHSQNPSTVQVQANTTMNMLNVCLPNAVPDNRADLINVIKDPVMIPIALLIPITSTATNPVQTGNNSTMNIISSSESTDIYNKGINPSQIVGTSSIENINLFQENGKFCTDLNTSDFGTSMTASSVSTSIQPSPSSINSTIVTLPSETIKTNTSAHPYKLKDVLMMEHSVQNSASSVTMNRTRDMNDQGSCEAEITGITHKKTTTEVSLSKCLMQDDVTTVERCIGDHTSGYSGLALSAHVADANLLAETECTGLTNKKAKKRDSEGTCTNAAGAVLNADDHKQDEGRENTVSVNQVPVLEKPLRKSQRRTGSVETLPCPVCKVAVKVTDMNSHMLLEISRLEKWSREYRKKSSKRLCVESHTSVVNQPSSSTNIEPEEDEPKLDHASRYKLYLEVRKNREKRTSGSDVFARGGEGTECPVCNKRIVGNMTDVNRHVNKCLVKEDGDVDIEGSEGGSGVGSAGSNDGEDGVGGSDDSFEEYEWAGQTRIRATSYLGNELCAAAGYTSVGKTHDAEDEDAELNIDDDETDVYGSNQYCEADLILCSADGPKEEKERQAIRKRLLQGDSASSSGSGTSHDRKWSPAPDQSQSATNYNYVADGSAPLSSTNTKQELELHMESFKKELAERNEKYKCLVCMSAYDVPVTSIQCWHVYCEECWLRTLGAKKLCPQCNMITHPTDLRKIYL